MNNGKLIRQLRLERGLTQAQLASGIINRTTLALFETNNTQTSFTTILALLDRLNVSIDEYQFLLHNQALTEKASAKMVVQRLIDSSQQEANSPAVTYQLTHLLEQYRTTGDFFYYGLHAQLFLLKHRDNIRFAADPHTAEIRVKLQTHLIGIETWGRFELTLFVNCLFVFDDVFIEAAVKTSLKRAALYQRSAYYRSDLLLTIVHLLLLSAKRRNLHLFRLAYRELTQLAAIAPSVATSFYVWIFAIVSALLDKTASTQTVEAAIATLSLLKLPEWEEMIRQLAQQERN